MAKTKATKTAKKVVAKTETETLKATAMIRKGALAYVGMYGAAYDRAIMRFEQVRSATDGMFDTLVARGEKIEGKATVFAKDAQSKATETLSTTTEKVRAALPKSANDRVEALQSEVATLNKKISTLSKKATKKTPVRKIKTEKTVTVKTETKAAPKAA